MILYVVAALSFGLLAVAWIAYPAAMWLRARASVSTDAPAGEPAVMVNVVVATRDEPEFAVARVRNLLDSSYPSRLLSIVVAVDPGAGRPLGAYREALGTMATVVAGDEPGGKAATLNAGVRAAADADVLVFADVGQEFNREAIALLVSALSSGRCGAATGRYEQRRNDPTMVAYAGLEALVRAGQSAGRGVASASGSILALSPRYWRPLPAGLICDDLFTGLSVVRQGSRVAFVAGAVAFDPRSFTREQQLERRVRTLTGLIQYLRWAPWSLVPWKNRVWIHFLLHKVFRLLTPALLGVGALALLLQLALRAPVVLLAGVLALAAAMLVLGALARGGVRRVWADVLWLVRLQAVPAMAIANALRGRWAVWAVTPQHAGEPRAGGGGGAGAA